MVKTATKGIAGFLLAVVFVLGTLWWFPAAADAVEPPPPPVVPLEDLPSTFGRVAGTGSGLADNQIKFTALVYQKLLARGAAGTSATAVVVADAVPITAAAPLAKAGAAGSVVTGGFMAGWMLVDGGLAMYSAATGTDPMAGTCSQEPWVQSTIGLLYPFSSPDCTVAFEGANTDVTPGRGPLTHGSLVITYKGSQYVGPGATRGCYTLSGTVTSGFKVMVHQYDGNWAASQPGSTATVCLPLGGTHFTFLGEAARPTGPATPYSYFIFPTSTTSGYTESASVTTFTTTPADPGRVPKCDLTWPDGSTTTRTGTAYTESAGLPLNSFQALCNDGFVSKPGHGPGLLPSEIKIGSTREDTGAYTEIAVEEVPDFTESERAGLTPGTAGGLVLQKVIGTAVSSCMNWDADCVDWWADTDEGTVPTTDSGEYRCLFNGAAVALVECGVYRNTFDEKTSTPTITDPFTGEVAPWQAGQPTPWNSISPATGPGTSPGDQCMASWPSAPDPLSWVFWPVRCAMVWAFVPRATVAQATTTALDEAWAGTWPAEGMAAVMGVLAVVPEASGCAGPQVHFELTWPAPVVFDAEPLNACNPPVSTLAWFARVIGALSIMIATAWGVTRRIGAVFNAPGVGPS